MKVSYIFKAFLLLSISIILVSCDSSEKKSDICDSNPCAESKIPNKTVCETKGDTDYTCICEDGYNLVGKLCIKDYCAENPCTEIQFKTVCENTNSGFTCSCDENHELKDGICKERGASSCYPTNPCKDIDNTNCVVTGPSDSDFTCNCNTGFHKDDNGACVETVNPCELNPCIENNKTICTANSQTAGDFTCTCDTGYHLKDEACVETIDPCLNDPCSANTENYKTKCKAESQTAGDFTCVCKTGYQLVGDICEEMEMSEGCSLPRYQEIFENDLTDLALLTKLNEITGLNYESLGYSSAKVSLYNNVDKIDDQNQCVYTGVWYNAGSGVNCEHTWPQSQFGRDEPMRSDLHHLFPTNSTVNSSRGHLRFANVSDHVDEYNDYDEYGQCDRDQEDYYCSKRLLSGGDNGIFEPADQHKGNVARAVFYFATRYGNMSGEINGVYAPFIDLDTKIALKAWNKLDPVDDNERNRNDRIEGWGEDENGNKTFSKLQGNRNPYIDCPELLDRIDLDNLDFPEEY